MSYRTIKRVLGETNLERKCRWWFGTSLFILLSLSFFWYGRRTDTIVKELNPKFIGPELVRAGWLEVHLEHLAEIGRIQRGQRADGNGAAGGGRSEFEDDFYRELAKSSHDLGRKYKWDAILPQNGFESPVPEKYYPRDDFEKKWLKRWAAPTDSGTQAPLAGKETNKPATDESRFRERGFSDRYVDEEDGGRSYQYYRPMYAKDSCVNCHKYMLSGGGRRPNLQAGDLMAIVRITTDYGPTAAEVAKNQALLWTAAIVVGFVSMFSLWAVVRYVIVKPVTHLRDVANAVREGDIEQRASIRTGDEFE
jgi:two-component system sensor histidine kinase BarA